MTWPIAAAALFVLLCGVTFAERATPGERSAPADIADAFSAWAGSGRYTLETRLDPPYLRGDFNGDGQLDVAVLVVESGSSKLGIAIIHGASRKVTLIGAGRTFGNGGDDFAWMDRWRVRAKAPASGSAARGETPRLKGDALWVEKTMAASALIYWTGSDYRWHQQGD